MLHRIAFVAVLGIGIVPALEGQETKGAAANLRRDGLVAGEEAPDQKTQEGQAAVRAALQKPLADVRFDDTPFSDAVDRLRDLTGSKIFVNFKTLESVGIDRNTPVSMHLRGKKFSTVLDLMLAIISSERAKLGYGVDGGVITITTQDDLAKNVVVRVYDIRDLILPQTGHQPQADRLTRLIEHQIDPKSWKSAGGSVGALRELEGQLIITQTSDNHKRVVALLEDLRSK